MAPTPVMSLVTYAKAQSTLTFRASQRGIRYRPYRAQQRKVVAIAWRISFKADKSHLCWGGYQDSMWFLSSTLRIQIDVAGT